MLEAVGQFVLEQVDLPPRHAGRQIIGEPIDELLIGPLSEACLENFDVLIRRLHLSQALGDAQRKGRAMRFTNLGKPIALFFIYYRFTHPVILMFYFVKPRR